MLGKTPKIPLYIKHWEKVGRQILNIVFPNITIHPTLNASGIPNFCRIVLRLKTRGINSSLVEHRSIGHRFVCAFFPGLGVYQFENAIVNISLEVGNIFSDTIMAISSLQSELHSLANVVLKKGNPQRVTGVVVAQGSTKGGFRRQRPD